MNFIPSLTKKGIDKFTSDSQNIILYAAKSSLKIKKKKYRSPISNVSNKKWFDKECRLRRHTSQRWRLRSQLEG